MEKRLKVWIGLCLLFVMNCCCNVFAETVVNKALNAEQAKGKAPNAKLYMTGSDAANITSVVGNVSGIKLNQKGELKTFEASGESIRYVVLLDNSGSVNRTQFEEAKNQLVKMRKNLKNADELLIYTVGTEDVTKDKQSVLGRVVSATETDLVKKDCKAINKIAYGGTAANKTILYRSLNELLEEQSVQASMDSIRTIILLITDGEDDSDDVKGSDNDESSTLKNVKNSSLPVYGILLNNNSKNPDTTKIKFTKNKILNSDNCHGYYYNCSSKSDDKSVQKAFKKITEILRDETYVVNLVSNTNQTVAGKNVLNLTVNDQAIDPVNFDFSAYDKDENAPVVVGSVKKDGKNAITFQLDDENKVNLSDAKDKAHYSLQIDGKKEKEKKWTIAQVNASQKEKRVKVTLTIDEEFYNQDYILRIDGIRDESQDQNAMNNVEVSFTVDDGLNPASEAWKEFIQKYWWISVILLLIIIGCVVVFAIKKRAVKVVEVDPDELNKADSRIIRITVTDRVGTMRDVEWNVEGSLFIGRSEICNLFFDDDRLSKQHFVIEVTKMGCYIEDLESTNGTFVNGVRMTNRRLLLDGDVVTAGREKFVFHIPKNTVFSDREERIV